MDAFRFYNYGTAGWLAIQAIPLIVSPTLIVALLSPKIREPTPLECYFARSLGITLATMGILAVILTGSMPLTSTFSDSDDAGTTTDPTDPKAPYALPALTVTTLYHSLVAFYSYTRWVWTEDTTFAISACVGGTLAAVGLWCFLFATSKGVVSKRTGADKRTSGWPFVNKEADKRKGKKGL